MSSYENYAEQFKNRHDAASEADARTDERAVEGHPPIIDITLHAWLL